MIRWYYPYLYYLLILILLTYKLLPINADLAEYLNNPVRILEGQIPYRDFWLLFPPGEVYLPAVVYKLFGVNINLMILLGYLMNFVTAFIGYTISYRLTKKSSLSAATGLLIFFHAANGPYSLLTVFSAYLLLNKKKNLTTFTSGLILGTAFWFRVYEIIAIAIAFGLYLVSIKQYKKTAILALGSIVPVLIMILIFWDQRLLMFDQLVLQSLHHGTTWTLPYFVELKAYIDFATDYVRQNGNSFSTFVYITKSGFGIPGMLGLYLLVPLSIVITIRQIILVKELRTSPVLFLLLWTLLLFPRALGRGDLAHLTHAALPSFILVAVLLSSKLSRSHHQALKAAFLLSLWSIVVFTYKNTSAILKTRYELSTPYGSFQTLNESEARIYQSIFNYTSRLKDSDYIFVTGWELPPVYALSGLSNPTHYDSLIDLLAQPQLKKEISICQSLKKNPPKIIIHDFNGGISELNHKFFAFSQLTPALNSCLDQNFEAIDQIGPYTVLQPITMLK